MGVDALLFILFELFYPFWMRLFKKIRSGNSKGRVSVINPSLEKAHQDVPKLEPGRALFEQRYFVFLLFTYSILFAVAFPIGGLVSLVLLWYFFRVHLHQLFKTYRRQPPSVSIFVNTTSTLTMIAVFGVILNPISLVVSSRYFSESVLVLYFERESWWLVRSAAVASWWLFTFGAMKFIRWSYPVIPRSLRKAWHRQAYVLANLDTFSNRANV